MSFLLRLLAMAFLCFLTACGGGSYTSSPPPPPPPTPSITALSPNSSIEGGSAFTLSVVGTNFDSTSTVRWNGSDQPTTLVNANLITAAIPASEVATPGPDAVTVANQGTVSTSVTFTVPCVIPTPSAASSQTKARLGAYYFDGWSGPLTNFHFQGLPLGPFQDRQPLSGWQDNSDCSVEQQLATAHNFGIDFSVFDWYFNTSVNDPGEDLNSAPNITHSLSDRHGMQYAILYVDAPPFVAQPADWAATVNQWVDYMADPAYVHL
jgi:IPT/TIG domain-containing protein